MKQGIEILEEMKTVRNVMNSQIGINKLVHIRRYEEISDSFIKHLVDLESESTKSALRKLYLAM